MQVNFIQFIMNQAFLYRASLQKTTGILLCLLTMVSITNAANIRNDKDIIDAAVDSYNRNAKKQAIQGKAVETINAVLEAPIGFPVKQPEFITKPTITAPLAKTEVPIEAPQVSTIKLPNGTLEIPSILLSFGVKKEKPSVVATTTPVEAPSTTSTPILETVIYNTPLIPSETFSSALLPSAPLPSGNIEIPSILLSFGASKIKPVSYETPVIPAEMLTPALLPEPITFPADMFGTPEIPSILLSFGVKKDKPLPSVTTTPPSTSQETEIVTYDTPAIPRETFSKALLQTTPLPTGNIEIPSILLSFGAIKTKSANYETPVIPSETLSNAIQLPVVAEEKLPSAPVLASNPVLQAKLVPKQSFITPTVPVSVLAPALIPDEPKPEKAQKIEAPQVKEKPVNLQPIISTNISKPEIKTQPVETKIIEKPTPLSVAAATPQKQEALHEYSQDYLEQISNDFNKNLPLTNDKTGIRVEKTSVNDNRQLIYDLTLTKYTSSQILLDKFVPGMKEKLKANLCNQPDTKLFLKDGISILSRYKGMDEKPVAEILISPQDCSGQ